MASCRRGDSLVTARRNTRACFPGVNRLAPGCALHASQGTVMLATGVTWLSAEAWPTSLELCYGSFTLDILIY